MICVRADTKELNAMLKAMVLNDELYEYAMELSQNSK